MDARHQFDGMPPQKRAKNEEETPVDGEVDRISDLPEGVLHHLLSLMPAHDAVRTSVLARRWRHLWRSAPAIRFTTRGWSGSADRFNQFVDRVLLLRRHGAPLESCDFHLLPTEVYSDEFLDANKRAVKRWIWRALRRQVRVLRFCHQFGAEFVLPNLTLVSQQLTVLKLDGVSTNESLLDFSGCPSLVDLTMEGCFANSHKISSSSLKHLRIDSCFLYDENHRTRMSLPNLVSLELDYILGRTPLLESMPSLETAIVRLGSETSNWCDKGESGGCSNDLCEGCRYYWGSDYDHGLCVLLGSLSQATDLELSAGRSTIVFRRDLKWCPAFSKLQTLFLDEWVVADDLSPLIWFLQHSPILEKLSLQLLVQTNSAGTAGRYVPIEQAVASDHLEVVEIKCREVDDMVVAILKVLNVFGIPQEKIQIYKQVLAVLTL
uniref:Uncharacterized protein n=1 Tax=Avena sativa TaxID=4498 RepID=A0ACD5X575_AVESA